MTNRLFLYISSRSPGDRLLLFIVGAFVITSGILSLLKINEYILVTVPRDDAVFREGLIGVPSFINPILAITQTDKTLVALTYSGLMQVDIQGAITPNLAESISIDDSGLLYTVTLRTDIFWSDGKPVTVDDVVFTIGRIQDTRIASPLRAYWSEVSVTTQSDTELTFTLPEANSAFIEQLTVGILPEHIWEKTEVEGFPYNEANIIPVGSGPYVVDSIKKDNSGIPTAYTLRPNPYTHNTPYIHDLIFKFYTDDITRIAALERGDIDAIASIDPYALPQDRIKDGTFTTVTAPLSRSFILFFNQNKSDILRDKTVRTALDAAIDRNQLVAETLDGYGTPLNGPIPDVFTSLPVATSSRGEVEAILEDDNWILNATSSVWEKEIDGIVTPLTFTITTLQNTFFSGLAQQLQKQLATHHIPITIQSFDRADLIENAIKGRDYEMLLYGVITGRSLDLYPFWHSSARTENGLNIALYTNLTADTALESIRNATSSNARIEAYAEFTNALSEDIPALFLFSPDFIYLIPTNLTLTIPYTMILPEERFSSITTWYRDTERVWSIFAK